MNARLALGLLAAVAVTSPLLAHGGAYRGPGLPASTPVPPNTGTPGPKTADSVSWQVWWELNKDPFVQQRPPQAGPTTGSDDFYLGQRRNLVATDTWQPSDADLRDRIVPAIAAALATETNRDIQTACLMALGKIGIAPANVDLERLLAKHIACDDQEVRETAVLALGVAGRPEALPFLASLLRNDAEGKRLCQREDVGDRTRAFAAYGLGLLARRDDDAGRKQTVHDLLWALLGDADLKHRDLRTAAVSGMGLLVDPQALGTHKRLQWLAVEELLAWYQRDLGRADEAIQAHAPVAIGRLLGRGDSPLHRRCKQHFAAVLNAAERRSNPILQSAALALGMLCRPDAGDEDGAANRALQAYWTKGHDQLARSLAVIALGRIGGTANRTWLLDAYQRANRNTERPWLALAVGLIAAESAARGVVDAEFADMLCLDIAELRKTDSQAAMFVAIGLTGHQPALPTMLRFLRDSEHDETLAGYGCIGVALLGDPSAAPALSAILERSKRRPFLLQQAAVGLGRLGDRSANDRLLTMLEESESLAVLSAIATAIGLIGDRRAIDPLVAMTKDQELTKLARAFVVAALGGVGDRSALPWNLPLSRDSNYGAPVDTLSNGATGVLDIL